MTQIRPGPLWGAAGALVLILCAVLAAVPSSYAVFTARVVNPGNTIAMNPFFTCTAAAAAAQAYYAYPLDELTPNNATRARDVSGNNRQGTYQTSAAHSTASACARDGGGSTTLNGTSNFVSTPNLFTSPQTFSTEVWFRTSTTQGVLVGFGNSLLGISTNYDRHIYFTPTTGQLNFGVYNNATFVIQTPAGTNYANGVWHHVVATMSSAGMRLYVDGALVGTPLANSFAEGTTGYWRFGNNPLGGWPNTNTAAPYFRGELGYGAVYTTALSADVVKQHYAAGI